MSQVFFIVGACERQREGTYRSAGVSGCRRSIARHSVWVHGLDITGAQLGGGLGGFALALPIAGANTGNKQDGHVRSGQYRPSENSLKPSNREPPAVRISLRFGTSDPVPDFLLKSRGQR